jgi:hypothetical protein
MKRHRLTLILMLIVFCSWVGMVRADECDACTSGSVPCTCGTGFPHGTVYSECEGVVGTIPAPEIVSLISSTLKMSKVSDRCADPGQTSTPSPQTATVSWTESVNWSITLDYVGTISVNVSDGQEETFNAGVAPPCDKLRTQWLEDKYNITVTFPVTYYLIDSVDYYDIIVEWWELCNSVSQDCGTFDKVASGTMQELVTKYTNLDCPECPECEVNPPPANL